MTTKHGMQQGIRLSLLAAALGGAALAQNAPAPALVQPQEKHLKNVRQLTFKGENAEAYFSADDKLIVFQAHEKDGECDQIYSMDLQGQNRKLISTGKGKTTCGYSFPNRKKMLFASTHGAGPECPPPPDYRRGYVWKMYPEFDLYTAKPDGSGIKPLVPAAGYDAEATISRNGKRIVFTSARSGDFDIYTMDANGKNLRRVTSELGYDGGPFFSPDGQLIVYRAHHPGTPEEIAEYKELLKTSQLRPTRLEIWVMNVDGSGKRKLTSFGAASFAPFFHPDGKRIIFASNLENPRSRNFDLYMVNLDGKGLERITYHPTFDSFPMFTSDGKKLIWASNRNESHPGNTNLFIADWVD
jgi:Tol biopolymer transport system component